MRHARLAPSASHRWMNCSGSIEATKGLSEDPANLEAACYGTGAHCFSEKLLRNRIFEADDRHLGKTFRYRFNDGPAELTVDADFIQHVNVYLARVEELSRQGGKLTIEQLVQLDCIRAEMFGHMDALIDEGRKIIVADLKFGFVPVFVAENPDALLFNAFDEADINTQLLCYAAGALDMCHWLPEEVQLEVIQPRSFEVEPIQSINLPTAYVEDWVNNVAKPAAERAEDPNAPRTAGEWCRFCPAKMTCDEFNRHNSQVVTVDFKEFVQPTAAALPAVDTLSTEQLLNILKWTPILDAFLREVNAHAFQLLMSGSKDLAGYYKLVRGRSTRYWNWESYEEGALELSAAILAKMKEAEPDLTMEDAERIFKTEVLRNITVPIELRSPKQIEDQGGAYKAVVKELARKRSGNLTLAVDSDRRKAVEPFTEYEDMGLGDD